MAHCVYSLINEGVDNEGVACMVHTAYVPCTHNGEPANRTAVHGDLCAGRAALIQMWTERTDRQRPLHIHRGDMTDGTHRVEEDGVCPCGPEILQAERQHRRCPVADQSSAPTCGVAGNYSETTILGRTALSADYGPCAEPATDLVRFRCDRGHERERTVCAAHVDVLTRPGTVDVALCVVCFDATGEEVALTPLVAPPDREPVAQPWRCPNSPGCQHPAVLHDVAEMDDLRPMCVVDGCRCGREAVIVHVQP